MVTRMLQMNVHGGLRSQSAARFVEIASKFQSQLIIEKGNKRINAKSIMGVLSLGVSHGEQLKLCASGEDEKDAAEALAQAVKAGLE